jgi:L,D-transpeptidase-like protein
MTCVAAMFAIGVIPAAASAASGSNGSTSEQTTTPTSQSKPITKPTKPVTPPASSRAKGSMRLYLFDAFFVSHEPVTVPGRAIHVTGIVRPYVPGQWVNVKVFLGKKLYKRDRLRVKPSKKRTYGAFAEKLKLKRSGTVHVEIAHRKNPLQVGFIARRNFSVLSQGASFGSRGPYVELIQQRLAALHFYIHQTGVYDQGTGLAVDAYHRLLRHGTSQTLDLGTANDLIDGVGSFKVRYPSHGKHVEGDLTRQLLALIDRGRVQAIYPISSGKPSTPTILGHFRVYLKTPGYLPDGMYYSNFFIRGYAVHGYDPAPDYPASHGCMRLPISDAISVYNWLNIGDRVDVYYE